MTVLDAPEPTDVLFENIQCGTLNRFGRNTATSILKYSLLFIGFALISFAAGIQIKFRPSSTSGEECDVCDYGLSLEMTDAQEELYSYCFLNGYTRPNGSSCGDFGPCYE